MKAPDILKKSAQHMLDRATTYDKPEGERSMTKTVQAFNAITGRDITTAEGWLMLAVLKQVRAFQNPGKPHVDSLEDGPAYLALMAEEMLSGGVSESEAPAPKYPSDYPKLAVGQVWKDCLGREVTIVSSEDYDYWPFNGSNGESFTPNGYARSEDEGWPNDLVELIQNEHGWIPWKATKDSVCPVSGASKVIYRMRDGSMDEHPIEASSLYWDHVGDESIVSYKVIEEAQQ